MSRAVEVLFVDGTKKVYENAEAENTGEFLKIYHGKKDAWALQRGEVRMEDVKSWENIGQGEDEETEESNDQSKDSGWFDEIINKQGKS